MPFHKKSIDYSRLTIVKKAFTLIELLLAITILGILAGFITVTITGQQKKARDAERKNSLNQIKRAMESAKNDCHASTYYPVLTGANEAEHFNATADHLNSMQLLNESPRDPKDPASQFTLHTANTLAIDICPDSAGDRTIGGAKYYVLKATLEVNNDPNSNKSRTACASAISNVTFSTAPAANDGNYYVCPD